MCLPWQAESVACRVVDEWVTIVCHYYEGKDNWSLFLKSSTNFSCEYIPICPVISMLCTYQFNLHQRGTRYRSTIVILSRYTVGLWLTKLITNNNRTVKI